MAAHEEARAGGFQGFDDFPGIHVDDGNGTCAEVGGGHYAGALVVPGNAGTQVGHAGQGQIGDGFSGVHVDHQSVFTIAGSADKVFVARVEEEVVKPGVGLHSAYLCPVVFYRDLPGFGNVFQGSDEAVPGWGGVNGTYP